VATIEKHCGELIGALYADTELARRFVFEITETKPICDKDKVHTFVSAVKAAHASVAFDDFGDGNFTLENIKEFLPEIIKISDALMRDRRERADELAAVVSLAANYGMAVVAEVIDSEEKRADCIDLGIQFAQGYLVGTVSAQLEVITGSVIDYRRSSGRANRPVGLSEVTERLGVVPDQRLYGGG
jgi:EAL domain-containing protein (putative c-di-GMP-specific phosphodiesterase class I)